MPATPLFLEVEFRHSRRHLFRRRRLGCMSLSHLDSKPVERKRQPNISRNDNKRQYRALSRRLRQSRQPKDEIFLDLSSALDVVNLDIFGELARNVPVM